MHAVIHLALKQYLEGRYGVEAWLRFLQLAGVSTTLPYVRVGEYPDDELFAIIAAASRDRHVAPEHLLEDFGAATASDLIAMYPRLVRPEWRSLDLICNTEETIHQVVRQRQPGARPAVLQCERSSATEMRLTYVSPRKLCAMARGIIRGIGRHYGESLAISHPVCMLRGDATCEILVRVTA